MDQEMTAAGAEPVELADVRLVRALRQGDAAAFETIYRRCVPAVYGLARHLCGRPDEAEDLVQEVFVRAWAHRDDFQSLEHLKRWLRKVALNTWISRQTRGREPSLDELAVTGFEPVSPDPPPGTAGMDVRRALAALPPALRAVVVLFDLYGLRHDEIAELVGVTAGTSKVQLHRARQRLKEWLQ